MNKKLAQILTVGCVLIMGCNLISPVPSNPLNTDASEMPEQTPEGGETPGSLATETAAPEPSGEALCPGVDGPLVPFSHSGHGYCLLIPSGYIPYIEPEKVTFKSLPYGTIDLIIIQLEIRVEPVGEKTLEDFVKIEVEKMVSGGGEASEIPREPIQIGSHDGIRVEQIYGRWGHTVVVLIIEEFAYFIKIDPYDPNEYMGGGEPFQKALVLWNVVLETMMFYPPTVGGSPMAVYENCTLDSELVAHETFPDGKVVSPGQPVYKKWVIRNNGTCAWGAGLTLGQIDAAESPLSPSEEYLPVPLAAPGEQVEMAAAMVVPDSIGDGDHMARFQMMTEAEYFGEQLHVWIKVSSLDTTRCGQHLPDMKDYVDETNGYCLIYTDHYLLVEDGASVSIINPANSEHWLSMDVDVVLTITSVGDVQGLTLEEFSQQQLAKWGDQAGSPALSDVEIDGYAAILAEGLGLPADHGTLEIYVIANGKGYVIRQYPEENAMWSTLGILFLP